MHMDAVRAGIILYGMWPSDEVKRDGIVLEPLLSLKSRIAYIKELDAGQEMSYGGTFCTANPMRVATIPVGYADGYPRGLLQQRARCSDCRKARKDPGTRLHGSVHGRCDKDS